MSKYGKIIETARKIENQVSGIPENQNSGVSETKEDPEVNLSIKVPLSLRRHWASEAKRQGTTLTAAITEALSTRFGPGI